MVIAKKARYCWLEKITHRYKKIFTVENGKQDANKKVSDIFHACFMFGQGLQCQVVR